MDGNFTNQHLHHFYDYLLLYYFVFAGYWSKKGSKKYELEFHARTGKLLEYEWELTTKSSNKNNYIGTAKAKEIALKKVGGGHVIKVEFDMDDGVPVYEVEIIKGDYEYDVEIHAKTGKILELLLEVQQR